MSSENDIAPVFSEKPAIGATPTQTEAAFQARTEALLTELSQAAERRYRNNRRWGRLMKASALYWFSIHFSIRCLEWLHVSPSVDFRFVWRILFYLYFLALVPMLIRLSGGELLFGALTKKRTTHLERLLQELGADPRAVGAVAQFTTRTESLASSGMARKILVEMLPRVTAGDARYISDSQMEALLGLLDLKNQAGPSSEHSQELPLAILEALEQIGDSRAIEPVRRLTTGRRNRLYHEAAQECLTSLEQQGETRGYNRTLLLPTSPEVGKETLLRATTSQEKTPSELLLRATTHEERG